jgi:hypothetical protein
VHKVDITYKDYFDGNQTRTETMYFNVNAFELAEMAAEFDGPSGLVEYMRKAFATDENYKDGFQVLKMLFVKGYGRRQEIEGRSRFIKNPAWLSEILPSPEFEAVFLKLSSDTKFATDFWNGIVSEELLARAEQIREAQGEEKPAPSKKLFRDMTLEEQVAAMKERAAASGVSLEE